MRTIYVDSDHKCHVIDDGTMTAVELEMLDGKCDAFVEGYCYDIEKAAMYPWVDFDVLDAAQRQYETMLAQMDEAYREGVKEA